VKKVIPFLFAFAVAIPTFAQSPRISQSEVRLEPAGDTGEDDLFGGQVALSGNTMVISGQGADSPTIPDSGAVFVFERAGNAWTQTARLMASDARTRDDFGSAVAISEDGDTIIVTAEQQNDPSPLISRAGVVYVFQRVGGSWTQQAELTSPTPALNGTFGSMGIAISHDTIAIGDGGGFANGFTPGIDVFTRSGNGWHVSATLTFPEDFAFFPTSVALDGDRLVATSTNSSNALGGIAYVFRRQDGNWLQEGTLIASDDAFITGFGTSVSIKGNAIVIGAPFASANSYFSGAAYLFGRNGNGWQQEAKLQAPDGAQGDLFGASVSVFGSTAVIGAPFHLTAAGVQAGSTYVFRNANLIAEVSASDGVFGGAFGDAVALHDSTLLVGAIAQHPEIDNGTGYPGGEAYVYRIDQ
jgi:FG-GAP repeat protein